MSDVYKILSDPIRRSILKLLGEKEHTQSELVQQFAISQPALTKHLRLLKKEGLILERRVGRFCYYRLNATNFEASYHTIRSELEQILDHKLERLKLHVEKKEREKNGS